MGKTHQRESAMSDKQIDNQPSKKFLNFKEFDGEFLVAGRAYWFVLLVLVVVIVTTAVLTSKQTYERHTIYNQLMQAREQAYELDIEHQRLIVEQQTFITTPIVAKDAVTKLGMYYPNETQKLTLVQEIDPPLTPQSND